MKIALLVVLLSLPVAHLDAAVRGAEIPWTTYEAEEMSTTGERVGPNYGPNQPQAEASQQQCVKLAADKHVEFKALKAANTLVLRYSLPDGLSGGGQDSELELFQNGEWVRTIPVTSRLSWLYGSYPFTNELSGGHPRNFFDEVRIKDLPITAGDTLKLVKKPDAAEFCLIDFADLEQVNPPTAQPENSLSATDPRFGAAADGLTDDTEALRKCIAAAVKEGRTVWLPPGEFKVTGDLKIPPNTVLQGSGMWHSTLIGDIAAYADSKTRVRIIGFGANIHLSDFAILGKLDYRKDAEPNDGIVGSFGNDSTIRRVWIEHTKAGIWVNNSANLLVEGCRFRNTIADGLNFCVGMVDSTASNCTSRGTGDDGFALWPATHMPQKFQPGGNRISHCTAQFPFLGNGAAIYGGHSNRIEGSLFTDVLSGCGVLISTTFPTADPDKGVDNHFDGVTVVEDSTLIRCGGFDQQIGWRGALQIFLERRGLSGLRLTNLLVSDSISDGVSLAGSKKGANALTDATFENLRIPNAGLGAPNRHGLSIKQNVGGELLLLNSEVASQMNESPRFIIRNEKPNTAGPAEPRPKDDQSR